MAEDASRPDRGHIRSAKSRVGNAAPVSARSTRPDPAQANYLATLTSKQLTRMGGGEKEDAGSGESSRGKETTRRRTSPSQATGKRSSSRSRRTPPSQVTAAGIESQSPCVPEKPQENNRLLFLNVNQARLGEIDDVRLPKPYRIACRVLRSGLFDRTRTLDIGIPYMILDPIPIPESVPATFAEICDAVAADLATEIISSGKRLQVLWSGGIDSTTALVAVIRAFRERDVTDKIDVLLSDHSVVEHPRFYAEYIKPALTVIPVTQPVGLFVREDDLTVTGEHGDQVFGSFLAKEVVDDGTADLPYEDVIPGFLARRTQKQAAAEGVFEFLLPQVKTAPVPVRTAFDFLWWLNFSLKWQAVSLRLSVFRGGHVGRQFNNTRHFFRDPRFQTWSMAHPELRTPLNWRNYKMSAKNYLLDHTGDEEYYRTKTKEASLKNVLNPPLDDDRRMCVYMKEDFSPQFRSVDISLLIKHPRNASTAGIGAPG